MVLRSARSAAQAIKRRSLLLRRFVWRRRTLRKGRMERCFSLSSCTLHEPAGQRQRAGRRTLGLGVVADVYALNQEYNVFRDVGGMVCHPFEVARHKQ
jgi:hypothetical protein